MKDSLDHILTIILTISAVVIATAAIRNSFSPHAASAERVPPDYVKSWKDGLPIGHLVGGNSTAPVTILTFFDLECPACAGFHMTLEKAVGKRPQVVRAIYVPFPLSYHKFALPAARAGECAAQVGRYQQWVDAVVSGRDSLGLKSWGMFAQDAGITDTARIAACAVDTIPNARIVAGMTLGSKIGLDGTPMVLVNGWRFHQTPSLAVLDSAISIVLAGGHPE